MDLILQLMNELVYSPGLREPGNFFVLEEKNESSEC